MRTVEFVEVSSGFFNITNKVVLKNQYINGMAGNAYDRFIVCELPEGYQLSESVAGTLEIYDPNGKWCDIGAVDEERGIVQIVDSIHGFGYGFKIIDPQE